MPHRKHRRPPPIPQPDPELTAAEAQAAWLLQFEYIAWRRAHGLEPSRDRLNRWEQAMERLGKNNVTN